MLNLVRIKLTYYHSVPDEGLQELSATSIGDAHYQTGVYKALHVTLFIDFGANARGIFGTQSRDKFSNDLESNQTYYKLGRKFSQTATGSGFRGATRF